MQKDLLEPLRKEHHEKRESKWSKETYPFLVKPRNQQIPRKKTTSFGSLRAQGQRKCYVQDVFARLVHHLSKDEIQKLLHFELYMEMYKRTEGHSSKRLQKTHNLNQFQIHSPYFRTKEQNNQSYYSYLGMRQLMASQKCSIHLHEKDDFQIACILNYFFEEAVQIAEQQHDVHLVKIAEEVFSLSKSLPQTLNPNQREKTMVHISSLQQIQKMRPKKLSPLENVQLQKFFSALLDFSFAFCSSKTW